MGEIVELCLKFDVNKLTPPAFARIVEVYSIAKAKHLAQEIWEAKHLPKGARSMEKLTTLPEVEDKLPYMCASCFTSWILPSANGGLCGVDCGLGLQEEAVQGQEQSCLLGPPGVWPDFELDFPLGCGHQGEWSHPGRLCVQALQGLLEIQEGLQPLCPDPGPPQGQAGVPPADPG